MAHPALSYPRYSSFLSPFMRIGRACLFPMYPTIPHIVLSVFLGFSFLKGANIRKFRNSLMAACRCFYSITLVLVSLWLGMDLLMYS